MALARRYRRTPAELPALLAGWQATSWQALDAAADLDALERADCREHEKAWRTEAQRIVSVRSQGRAAACPSAVTAGHAAAGHGRRPFEVARCCRKTEPQAFGLRVRRVPRGRACRQHAAALAKVASGGELSRLALAIAVTTAAGQQPGRRPGGDAAATLIFDEIDSGGRRHRGRQRGPH